MSVNIQIGGCAWVSSSCSKSLERLVMVHVLLVRREAPTFYIAILRRPYHLGNARLRIVFLFPLLSYWCLLHVWYSADKTNVSRLRPISRRWMSSRSLYVFICSSCQAHWHSIVTTWNLLSCGRYLHDTCRQRNPNCPYHACLGKTSARRWTSIWTRTSTTPRGGGKYRYLSLNPVEGRVRFRLNYKSTRWKSESKKIEDEVKVK